MTKAHPSKSTLPHNLKASLAAAAGITLFLTLSCAGVATLFGYLIISLQHSTASFNIAAPLI